MEDFIFHFKNRTHYLSNFIKPLLTYSKFVFWFSVDRKVFNLTKNVIFGIVYIPPGNTAYDDAFTEFELQTFNQNTNYIVLVGDFNSRTGNLFELKIEEENSFLEQNFFSENELSEPNVSNILDTVGILKVSNGNGREC